jgi:hypothetical protein
MEKKNAYRISVGKPEEKRSLERPSSKDNKTRSPLTGIVNPLPTNVAYMYGV